MRNNDQVSNSLALLTTGYIRKVLNETIQDILAIDPDHRTAVENKLLEKIGILEITSATEKSIVEFA